MPDFERTQVTVLELDLDLCANTYSIAPCTAAAGVGNECYNTFKTCQDKPNFVKTSKTYKFVTAGAPQPVGERLRPYITGISFAPTSIDIEKGLAPRGKVTVTLADEPDNDTLGDPYAATRATPAQGSFWTRLLARNHNYAGRFARIKRAYFTAGWDAGAFVTELYVIESISPPDSAGRVEVVLKDPVKLADRRKLPEPSSGKLSLALGAADLSLTLESGQGADYAPAGYVRVKDEVIQYTGNAADVLSWPDITYRAKFGAVAAAAKIGDGVQQCHVWENKPVSTVLDDLLVASGMPPANIDSAGFIAEDDEWLGTAYWITACIATPEDISKLLAELCVQTGSFMWWSPTAQKVKWRVLAPLGPTETVAASLTDAANVIEGSVKVTPEAALRRTVAGMLYDIQSAVADRSEEKNYLRAEIYIDADAEGANEYDDRRIVLTRSRWFNSGNAAAVLAQVSRTIGRYRDAPKKISLKVDPKDAAIIEGDLVDVSIGQLADVDGSPLTTRCIVTMRRDDSGTVSLTLLTTQLGARYAFFAPNAAGDYPADPEYAHFGEAGGADFSDGAGPYLFF